MVISITKSRGGPLYTDIPYCMPGLNLPATRQSESNVLYVSVMATLATQGDMNPPHSFELLDGLFDGFGSLIANISNHERPCLFMVLFIMSLCSKSLRPHTLGILRFTVQRQLSENLCCPNMSPLPPLLSRPIPGCRNPPHSPRQAFLRCPRRRRHAVRPLLL